MRAGAAGSGEDFHKKTTRPAQQKIVPSRTSALNEEQCLEHQKRRIQMQKLYTRCQGGLREAWSAGEIIQTGHASTCTVQKVRLLNSAMRQPRQECAKQVIKDPGHTSRRRLATVCAKRGETTQ